MSAHFEVYEDRAGERRWRLRAKNGEIVASGEGYPDEDGARDGIDDFLKAVMDATDGSGLQTGYRVERVEAEEAER